MKKVRWFICSLMVLLLVPTLSGCKKSENLPDFVIPEGGYDNSEVTIRFYHTMGQPLQNVLNVYIEAFEELYPNITVNSLAIGGYDDVRDQIKTELSIGEQANLVYCYPDHVATYNKAKSVIKLDTLMDDTKYGLGLTAEQKADFIEAYYNEGKQFGDDKMYCLPFSKSTEVLYYNKTFFTEHELNVPTTWEEMESVCQAIKVIDPKSIPLGYDSDSNWFITMCEQLDSPYTSDEAPYFLFDNQANRDFLTKIKGWYEAGLVTTKSLYGQYTSSLFTSRGEVKSYMSIGSSAGATNQVPEKINGVRPFETGIAAIPQVSATRKRVISQGPSVCILKSKNPQEVLASWLFTKYLLTSVEFQAEFSMTSGYVPVLKSVFANEVYQDFLDRADGSDNIAALSAKQCIAQESYYYSSPAFVGSAVARDEVGAMLAAVLSGVKGIDQAFKDAVDNCNYAIGQRGVFMKKFAKYLLIILLATTLLSCGSSSSTSTTTPVTTSSLADPVDYAGQLKLDLNDTSSLKKEVTLKTCIDGDTTHFHADINEDGVVKARYLAIDTPESTGTIQPWGKAAALFNKSKLENAKSIYIESDDNKWNRDSTTDRRILLWVWYKSDDSSDYRLLNLELLQEGYAATKNYSSTKYADIFAQAHNQAISLKLRYYGEVKDPGFDYGDYREVTLKQIRTHIDEYVDTNVRFEGVIVLNGGENTYTVVDWDLEDEKYYGIQVYSGYNFSGNFLLNIGNRLSFAATITYSENFGYQASGLTYFAMTPKHDKCLRLVSEDNEVEPWLIDVPYFKANDASISDTYVKVEGLAVKSIYTTTDPSTSSVGAMTLTCEDSEENEIKIRTSILYEEDGKTLVTAEAYENKIIDVIGTVDDYKGDYQVHVYKRTDITVKN